MMQQVAAQKTDIAALPFSASSTAKAVEAGMGAEDSSQNNNAFEAAYIQAKESSAKSLEAQNKGHSSRQTSTSVSDSANPAIDKKSADRHASDPERGNVDLPPVKDDEAQARNGDQADKKAQEGDLTSPDEDTDELIIADAQSRRIDTDTKKDGSLLIDGKGTGKEDSKGVGKDESQNGSDNKKDFFGGHIDLPPEELTSIGNGDSESPTDWIEYVTSMMGASGDDNVISDAEATAITDDLLDAGEIEDAELAAKQLAQALLAGDELAGEDVLSALASNNGSNESDAAVNGTLTSTNLPEDVDTSSATEITAYLMSLLENQAGEELGQDAGEGLSSETLEAVKALTAALLAKANENAATSDVDAGQSEKVDPLANLLAQFLGDASENGEETSDAQTQNSEHALLVEQEAADEQALSADEALVLSLLQEQVTAQTDTKETLNAALANGVSSQSTASTQTNSNPIDTVSTEASDILTDSQGESLLQSIAMMSPESAQKAAEAFAERVAASLPTATTAAQQQAVKSNLIAGINEFQQQVAQGREPGIDLSALVADAASEAGLTQTQMQNVAGQTDALAGQFMQLVNGTQQSAHQALQSELVSIDSHMNENNQVRAESTKSQLQFEGADKPVNILKPEGQQQLHEKIRWMVNARNSMAEIRLDPPELGSMQVRVNVSGDAASVSFIVQSQHAKDALADAMPRLKDMLAEQGINLGESEVRKDNSSQNGDGSGQQLAGNGVPSQDIDGEFDEGSTVIEQSVTREAKGGIDYYA
ncbi:flagellar hook-length control protein FliK [Alteromonas naphthalenivorans]|uniref:Polar flagellar hook-length control protein FliK n=1 Tax=Alteromonas naphthalenivorans TaxID=715451 RepID=F5ZE59_ALTNA|nr:flagellar hook-length control protein FliK [Alteromonas naphthalenivorans]AEF04171.1 polar flagellar hook-length control protein FliK [Alteromonas naphthalenivorans]